MIHVRWAGPQGAQQKAHSVKGTSRPKSDSKMEVQPCPHHILHGSVINNKGGEKDKGVVEKTKWVSKVALDSRIIGRCHEHRCPKGVDPAD